MNQIVNIEDIETTHMAELEQEIAKVEPPVIRTAAQRLLVAQTILAPLQKDVDAGRFKGVSGGQVFGKASLALSQAGLVFFFDVPEPPVQNGQQTTVKAIMAFVNADDANDRIVFSSYGQAIGNDAWSFQKAIQNAQKSGLLRALMFSDADDEISSEAQNVTYERPKQIAKPEMAPEVKAWAKALKASIEVCEGEAYLKKLIEDNADAMREQTDATRAFFDKLVDKRMEAIRVKEQLAVHNLAVGAMEELPE